MDYTVEPGLYAVGRPTADLPVLVTANYKLSFDRLGGVAGGFLETSLRSRGPYPGSTPDDVETLRRWYAEHFPEMLQL